MSLLDNLTPTDERGVIFVRDCDDCDLPVPVLGRPGKGRPLDTFGEGYFCTGHAVRLPRPIYVTCPGCGYYQPLAPSCCECIHAFWI